MTTLKPELDPLPENMRDLAVYRHMPVPWFVAYVNGEPDFRVMDAKKWIDAVNNRKCWVCGRPLGMWLHFNIGPMACLSRMSAEPPSHRDCALWSVRNCPFLSRPHFERREDSALQAKDVEEIGEMLRYNPRVNAIWVTRSYTTVPDGRGKYLIELGSAHHITWWTERRPATREEIDSAIMLGFPKLMEAAEAGGQDDIRELLKRMDELRRILPEV